MSRPSHLSQLLAAIPNMLSAVRIGLALSFPFALEPWRAWIVAVAALTDFLDGQIARRFKLTSPAGGLLDATADKLFVLSVLATLTFHGLIVWWAAALVLTRDVAVGCVAVYAAVVRRWSMFLSMPTSGLGKLTTVAQFGLFLSLLLPWTDLRPWTAGLAAGLSILAAGDYLRRLVRTMQESGGSADTASRSDTQ